MGENLPEMETLFYSRMVSPVGPLLLVVSAKGLVAVQFQPEPSARSQLQGPSETRWVESRAEIAPWTEQFQQYFDRQLRRFTLPLDLRGTEFQKCCWQALLEIPYGQTRTYAEMARSVGRPRAFRAVGMANHDNPAPIVVPCHRVIASDGSLAGYGGGLETKRRLLQLEGAILL